MLLVSITIFGVAMMLVTQHVVMFTNFISEYSECNSSEHHCFT